MAKPSGLEISKEMPVNEMADRIYEYWKSNSFIKFVGDVGNTMKPILLTNGLPNKIYKNFLRHFTFTYLRYDKRFITSLFQTALEENATTGIIRIVRYEKDIFYLKEVLNVKEPVFTDYKLLDKLIELAEIVPQILMDSKINKYSDAVLSNSIIIFLNNARPPIANNNAIIKRKRSNNNDNQPTKNRKIAWQAGTRKIRRKSKRTRCNKVKRN